MLDIKEREREREREREMLLEHFSRAKYLTSWYMCSPKKRTRGRPMYI
jgi:hypothetical protein